MQRNVTVKSADGKSEVSAETWAAWIAPAAAVAAPGDIRRVRQRRAEVQAGTQQQETSEVAPAIS
jgi:hypothetical protein